MQKIELELKDWKEMELAAIDQIRTGKKIILTSTEVLTLATININKLGGETEGELKARIKREHEEERKKKEEEKK